MQLNGVYDFLELNPQDGVDVWKAREKASGKLVLIHLFPQAKQPAANEICERLIALPPEARNKVKFGTVRDATCFVTDLLPEGENLERWVARQSAPAAPSGVQPIRAGAMENLRKLDVEPAPLAPLPPNPGRPSAAQPAGSERPPQMQPPAGAFTRLYSAQEIQATPQAKPEAPPPVPSHPSAADSWSKYYGAPETRTFEVPTPVPETQPESERVLPKSGNSLESFIFKRSEIVVPDAPPVPAARSAPEPRVAPMPLPPVEPAPSGRGTVRAPEPVPLFDLPPVPAPEPPAFHAPPSPMPGPSYPERRVKPIPEALPRPGYTPTATPIPPANSSPVQYSAPTAKTGLIDWSTVIWVLLILAVVLTAVIVMVEMSSRP